MGDASKIRYIPPKVERAYLRPTWVVIYRHIINVDQKVVRAAPGFHEACVMAESAVPFAATKPHLQVAYAPY